MSPASSSTVELTGQALVEAFVTDLTEYLKKSPGHYIKDTKQKIVQTIVGRSPRLRHANVNNLCRHLPMAVGAGCRSYLGLKYEWDGERVKVWLA